MTAQTIPERKDIPGEHQWDLSPLFKNDREWEKACDILEERSKKYSTFQGRLHESAEILKKAIEYDLEISRDIEKIFTWAHLKNDEDKSNQHYLGLYQRAVTLYTRISELSSYMTPEIQSIPDSAMEDFLRNRDLAPYRFFLEKILRYKPHTLSREIEQILAMSQEISMAPSQIFSQLDNTDLRFGNIENENGNKIELSHGNFISFLQSPSREVREKAFFQYYRSYEEHKNTIATALANSAKKDHFYSRVRKFSDCRNAALFSDRVSDEVYDNLIETVRGNLEPLFSYLRFRKDALGLEELRFFDTYVPLVQDVNFNMPYDEAVEVCVSALAPLGSEYTDILKKGLSSGWVDRYENRGKRSGAYSSGCYDSSPYILLNYRDDNINSLYTLIHEAGHSMHSFYSNRSQPYVYHDYTIFVAEVASTFNETLLSRHLLDLYSNDPRMTAYILNREIDNIRGTLFRQTMFAEFEKFTHASVEDNRPLTLETMTTAYRALIGDYFGDTMKIDDVLALECLRIPHFYSPFYVYKYATGISAAIALADRVLNKVEGARKAYLDFLSLGGSMFPLDELRTAGVDMASPAPVKEAITHFSELLGRFKEVYGKL